MGSFNLYQELRKIDKTSVKMCSSSSSPSYEASLSFLWGRATARYGHCITSQSCKNVRTMRTSRCYFFWLVLIFGKSTRKTGENTQKQAKTRENRRKTGAFLVLIFLWEKLVGANFYAFCNYGI